MPSRLQSRCHRIDHALKNHPQVQRSTYSFSSRSSPTIISAPPIEGEEDLEAFWNDLLNSLSESEHIPKGSRAGDVFGDEFFSNWQFISVKDIPVSITTDRKDGLSQNGQGGDYSC